MPEADHYHHYELLRRGDGSLWELGRGAMGITYKAYDTNLHCTVALKVIHSSCLDSDTAQQRFLREARAAAALRHQNVASVFHLGTDHGNYFYAMEFIDGETVEACIKRKGRLEAAEALNIVLQVTRALAAASKQRLVHRDLKPANLMLVDDEGGPTVKVIDFGLAKSAKNAGEDSSTLTMGGFVGTPHFASPEQVKEGEIDIRSDIYSLGATLYFMVTGKLPFSGSVGHVMSQHLYKPISLEPLTEVPRCVVSLIQRMMEKDRDLRPQTPRELLEAISDCLEQIRVPIPRGSGGNAGEAPLHRLSPGVILAHYYRLIEELRHTPQGRTFVAEDLRQKRQVCLLLLSPEFTSAPNRFRTLEAAVSRVRSSPHPMLRVIHGLETAGDDRILVKEQVVGPSLQDVLRVRQVLGVPEVVRLLRVLAPVADHATREGLQHADFTLTGIHLKDPKWAENGIPTDLLQRPLTAWEPLEPVVDAVDLSFPSSHLDTSAGLAPQAQDFANHESRGSGVRLLSLLAYELLDGPRARLEATGQYTAIVSLSDEGNAVLRRGVVDECPSADELAKQLAAAVGVAEPRPFVSTPPAPAPVVRAAPDPVASVPSPETPARPPRSRLPVVDVRRVGFLIGVLALLLGSSYAILRALHRAHSVSSPVGIAALSVQSEPVGAALLLDGKPPSGPPGTFAHVPFGSHQLTATLEGYEPLAQDLQVQEGMNPNLRVELQRQVPRVDLTPTELTEDAPVAPVLHKSGRYRGTLKVPGGGRTIPCTVELDDSGLAGTIAYGSRLGDTVVRFSGKVENDTLRADTGEVVSKPAGVRWSKETFTLTFRPDGTGAVYHCVEPSTALTGTLTPP
ncbi:MAG TPA: protein kinase [Chthoniobacterales bacterium]